MQNTPNNNIGLTLIFRRFREMDIENQKQYVSRDYLTISIDEFFERTKDLIKLMCWIITSWWFVDRRRGGEWTAIISCYFYHQLFRGGSTFINPCKFHHLSLPKSLIVGCFNHLFSKNTLLPNLCKNSTSRTFPYIFFYSQKIFHAYFFKPTKSF